MRFDCMSADELARWRDGSAASPCVDCPIDFYLSERSAGRCRSARQPLGGRPRTFALPWGVRRQRAAANRRYRASLRAQVECVRALRVNARSTYNQGEGSSFASGSISHDARLPATTRLAGVVASIEVVAR